MPPARKHLPDWWPLPRLVQGLSVQDWQSIARHPSIERWIAFPVEGTVYPFLQELQDRLDQLVFQSEHDPLCGLYNRRAFERLFELELNRCIREHRHLSLALIDLDDSKTSMTPTAIHAVTLF